MQIGGTIERRREKNVVRFAEIEDMVVQQRQIGGDDEIDLFVRSAGARFRGFYNGTDEGKIQQGLPSLELDLDPRCRARKRDVKGAHSRVLAHVEARAISTLTRDLAVGTGMLTSQGHHKNMQRCDLPEE